MAKSKTIWQWRGTTFSSKKELLAHLAQRAREAAQGVLGPPVDEVRGDDRRVYSVRFKVQVSLGAWPPRNRAARSPADAGDTPGRRQRLKPRRRAATKRGVNDSFDQ